jgi:hypothetical protein
MPLSLKRFTEQLAPLMGLSPAALYERQRQLVRLKLVKSSSTLGPGGGVRATPAHVAMLLIACLATDNLSEISAQIGRFARLKPKKGLCPLTRASSLGEALTRILSDREIADRVLFVHFYRSEGEVMITYKYGDSVFGGAPKVLEMANFTVHAILGGALLKKIAEDLHQQEQ